MSIARSTQVLAAIFAGSGVVHLARPKVYEPIMPSWVPAHREVILGSGVAELVLAAGLLVPATRRISGWGSVALLVGVFPANLKMVTDAFGTDNTAFKAVAVGRLPLQWPAIKAALTAARSAE